LFVLFYPVSIPYGIWAMWKNGLYSPKMRWALTAAGTIALVVLLSVANADDPPSPQTVADAEATATTTPSPATPPEPSVAITETTTATSSPTQVSGSDSQVSAASSSNQKDDTEDSAADMANGVYALEVGTITQEVGTALGELGRILTEDSTAVFLDPDVQFEVAVQMAVIRTGYDRVERLSPPSAFRGVHSDLLAAMKLYEKSMVNLAKGIDGMDGEKLDKALSQMESGNRKLAAATDKVEAIAGD
jgi:hypothetical protein